MCIKKHFSQNRTFPILWNSKQHFIPNTGINSFAVTKILCPFGSISETTWIKRNKFASGAIQGNYFSAARHGHSGSPVSSSLTRSMGMDCCTETFQSQRRSEAHPSCWFPAFTHAKNVRKVMPMCLRRKRRGYLD